LKRLARAISSKGTGVSSWLGSNWSLVIVAVVIGVVGGFASVLFRWMIDWFYHIAWVNGENQLQMVAGSPWYFRAFIPAGGGLIVGLLVYFFASEARGHGVPEVMLAVAKKGGVIRPIVAVIKFLASAVCIASGGSAGQEGPVIQIGAALGSTLGQWLKMPTDRIRTCVASGAAAGIAATFNAPVAGCLFALEIIMGDFAVAQFAPVVVSSVSATVISRSLISGAPLFIVPSYTLVSPWELVPYTVLGILAGLFAVAFILLLFLAETLFEESRIPAWFQPVIGGLAIGAMGLLLPELFGGGYDSITNSMESKLLFGTMALLAIGKLITTSLTLGSGGSGGIFAPSLFMGAMLGGLVGMASSKLLGIQVAPPGAYALVGMGAMVAASTHAPITGILIIFELTNDYKIILPLMISCILATLVASLIKKESIYTIKLVRRGVDLSGGKEVNILRKVKIGDVMRKDVEIMKRSSSLQELYKRMLDSKHHDFFIVDEKGALTGIVSTDALSRSLPDMKDLQGLVVAEDVADHDFLALYETEGLDKAMRAFGASNLDELPVVKRDDGRPVGSLWKRDLIAAYNREILKADLAGSVGSRLESVRGSRHIETLGEYVLVEVETPPAFFGKTFSELELRQKYGIQVILIKRSDDSRDYEFPSGNTVVGPGDLMLLLGRQGDVDRIRFGA